MAMDGKRTLARLGMVAALVAVELWLAAGLTSNTGVVGYTLTRSHAVAPQRRAKVKTVAVELGEHVTAGQLLAVLDPTEVDNAIQAATIESQVARAQIAAAVGELRTSRVFEQSERAAAELATTEATAHTAAAELAAVEAELREQRDLVIKHLADTSTQKTLELRRAALAEQVTTARRVLGVLRGNATAAAKRSAGLDDRETVVAPLASKLRAAELRLEQLERERAALSLRAPVDGVIEQLPLRPGDLASPEAPVAVVAAADTMRVVACVPEARAGGVEIGQEAELTSVFDRVHGTGAVESVTSEISPLPVRCQMPNARTPAMGRIAVVALDAPLSTLPGQSQIVHLQARRRAPRPASPKPPTGAAQLRVPAALLARTRFEPSGLVWVAALDRYLIVSDDTGFADRDEHAPWLFAMTRDGVVDPAPLVVTGVAELDDVEAIAAAPDGALWLLSSQSTSKKGKRPASRRQLVRAALAADNRSLRAEAVIDLATLLDRASATDRQALGIGDTRDLDLEGIAVHGGALYLGLKAPLANGRAQIWKITDPARLAASDLAGAKLALWATIELAVEADGRAVPGGIADMVFVDANTLLVATTAATGDPVRQDGALYVARSAAGPLAARRIKTFADRKPEGLAFAPNGRDLVIVFDRGSEPPEWETLALAQLGGS